jgi:membrane-associated phospholipid phosphatase
MKLLWLAIAAFSIYLYVPLARRSPHFYMASKIDKKLPLLPFFVIPYVTLYPYVLVGFAVLYATPLATAFYASVTAAALAAAIFWYFFPTGVHRPVHMPPGILTRLLKSVYGHAGLANAFPSSHVFLSFITSYYLALAFPAFALIIWIIGFVIALSTVFVKQHNVFDIVGGLAWAFGAILLAHWLIG